METKNISVKYRCSLSLKHDVAEQGEPGRKWAEEDRFVPHVKQEWSDRSE